MIELTGEQLIENYNKLISVINKFDEPRKTKLLQLFNDLEQKILIAPASMTSHLYGAYPGGYVIHNWNVIKNSINLYKIWHQTNPITKYTLNDLIFVAMIYNIGSVGDTKHENYLWNESDWHRENLGRNYTKNEKIDNMFVTERSFFLLQNYNIQLSNVEYNGILNFNRIIEEKNKQFLTVGDFPKSNMAYILHMADLMSYRIEWEKEHEKDIN